MNCVSLFIQYFEFWYGLYNFFCLWASNRIFQDITLLKYNSHILRLWYFHNRSFLINEFLDCLDLVISFRVYFVDDLYFVILWSFPHLSLCVSSALFITYGEAFLFLAESPAEYTRSATKNKTLVLSLRAECTRFPV